jgi:1-aminocyclopropane-1-carboxylate deaminase/D-cysteine desulfhydrase-like pyridoxal-dependent ACC family enzyme
MINLNYRINEYSPGNYILDENLNNSFISGNKVRKLNGILKDLKREKGLLTFGSVYSSHCLATAYHGKLLDLPVKLIVLTDETVSSNAFPHLKLSQKLGADLLFCSIKEAHQFIEAKQQELKDYYWIPGGGHTHSAAKEYELLFEELFLYNYELNKHVKSIILPFGTGTTAFGIYKGLINAKCDIKVFGVSVSRSKETCINAIKDLDDSLDLSNLQIIDDYAGKYHLTTEATENARNRFLGESGVLIDPIYNAKSLECFYRYKLKDTLIVNTGGMLNNFL